MAVDKSEAEAIELEEYFYKLEQAWRASLPRLSDTQWLEIFPEVKSLLSNKIEEWSEEQQQLLETAEHMLNDGGHDASDKYLMARLRVLIDVLPKINDTVRHIGRLRRQQAHYSVRPIPGRITDADIQRAKAVPIASLLSCEVRRAGRTLQAKCPLHNERTPSFFIYQESNTCWCFGCQQGGDSIKLVELLHGLSFIEAVKYLLRI